MCYIETTSQLITNLKLDDETLHTIMKKSPSEIRKAVQQFGYKISRRKVLQLRDLYWYDQPEYEAIKQQIALSFDRDLSRTANVEMAWLLFKAKVRDWWRWVAFN